MRIKNLFSVPEGKKVTEKMFGRVLISSICSILLCMACLVGTTWAWFSVSVENIGNEIQIATVTADVTVKQGDTEIPKSDDGSYKLNAGTYDVGIELINDATEKKAPIYVLVTINKSDDSAEYYCIEILGTQGTTNLQLGISSDSSVVTFSVSWIMPASVTLINDETAVIGELPPEDEPDEETEESTGDTNGDEPAGEKTDTTVESNTEPPVTPDSSTNTGADDSGSNTGGSDTEDPANQTNTESDDSGANTEDPSQSGESETEN